MTADVQRIIDALSERDAPSTWWRVVIGTRWVRRLLFVAVVLALWADVARVGPWPSYVLPGPADVAGSLWTGVHSGGYPTALATSVSRLLAGYGLAAVIGIALGVLVTVSRIFEETIGTCAIGLQALPSVCWLPLAILWFGLNDRAIVFVVVLGAVFSIMLGVERGIRTTPPVYADAARTLGARGWRLYAEVVLPAAWPAVLGGLKQGWAFAWRSLMAAELLFYSPSLGNLLQTGRDLNDAASVMAVMLLIVLVGLTFNQLIFAPLERRTAARWGLAGPS